MVILVEVMVCSRGDGWWERREGAVTAWTAHGYQRLDSVLVADRLVRGEDDGVTRGGGLAATARRGVGIRRLWRDGRVRVREGRRRVARPDGGAAVVVLMLLRRGQALARLDGSRRRESPGPRLRLVLARTPAGSVGQRGLVGGL